MHLKKARQLAWNNPVPRLPPPRSPVPQATEAEDSAEDAALIAQYEARQAAEADAECALGCDYSEGSLSPFGTSW